MSFKKLALPILGMFLLTSCSAGQTANSDSVPQATEEQSQDVTISVEDMNTLTIALVDEPLNLDFTNTAGAAIPTVLMQNVYQTLVNIDDKGNPTPSLATKWEVSPDGLTYTFTLAKDVAFSNGDAFNAQTAQFSLENVAKWTTNEKHVFEGITSIETPDEQTLVVTLGKPNQDFLFNLATHAGAMFTPNGMSDLATKPVGTGPYDVEERVEGDHITLRAKHPEDANVDVAVFKYYKDATAPVNALKTGDVDVIWYLQNVAQIKTLEQDFNVSYGVTNTKVMLVLNNKEGLFKDKAARIAATQSIDKQAVLDGANEGKGELLESATSPADPWNVTKREYPYDLQAAKTFFASAGASDVQFKVPTMPYATAAAQIVADQLTQAGLKVTIVPSEFPATWLQDVYTNHNFDATLIAHVEARDFAHLMSTDYYIGNTNADIPTQALAANEQADRANWVKDLKQAVDLSVKDAVVVPLYNLPNTTVMSKTVEGLDTTAILPQLVLSNITIAAQ